MHGFIFLVNTFKVTDKVHFAYTNNQGPCLTSEIFIVESLSFGILLDLFLCLCIHMQNMYLEKNMTLLFYISVLNLKMHQMYQMMIHYQIVFFKDSFFLLRFYLFIFRRGEGMEKGRETSMCGCPSLPPIEDLAHNPGTCPDWELNQRPFGLQPWFNQSTELYQPGPNCSFQSTEYSVDFSMLVHIDISNSLILFKLNLLR